ncbi:MAG: hypothetical protein RJQ14_07265 [Marinoscillum sp.]
MESNDKKFLKRSANIYKVYFGLFLFSILMTFIKRAFEGIYDVFDMLIGLPAIAVMVFAPVGLAYTWKSKVRQEGKPMTRFLYFIGHSFFCLLTLVMILSIFTDILRMF